MKDENMLYNTALYRDSQKDKNRRKRKQSPGKLMNWNLDIIKMLLFLIIQNML